jgi:divalent metal cation (Fe/Co/Zn/Cd) transporter
MPQLDAIIGLVIAAVILAVLVASMRTVVHRLMDGVDEGTLDAVESAAAAVPGVHEVQGARARWSGHRMETELSVTTDAGLSLSQGHRLAEEVEAALVRAVPHLDRAVVRVVPAASPREHVPAETEGDLRG